jgi:putative iron-dependent peroxidase
MGRAKLDSVELEDKASDSHVASTDQDRFGKIFRRNMPYGTVTDHGTMFVGFSAEQRPLTAMLESMAGLAGGARDALTRYTRPITGAYYFVPSTEDVRRFI